ncbi:SMI1/KNR4 family protein [Hyalangium versicolor]|uniref:SMI1/KNR4 family protein n=1 Tax=Hyalangium versicolor TaxID=2861190 RepID=UPI001CD00A8B|nr:SMI1/KNR4 family protein [Hyalangium versicolor]
MTFDELAQKLELFSSKSFGQGASEDDIDAASDRLGVRLAGGYRSFLRRFGWGGVESFELFGLGSDVPPYLDLTTVAESERTEMHPGLASHLIPLMNDGGGNLYCLDSRATGEPTVVFWDHTASEKQIPSPVAPDFVSWLAERISHPD